MAADWRLTEDELAEELEDLEERLQEISCTDPARTPLERRADEVLAELREHEAEAG